MIDLSYDFIITLQKEVSRRFGVDSVTASDCKRLSLAVSDETGKLVSETTLKRVFGFAVTQHSFSRYTLNTLAQYCRYKDWEDFQTRHFTQSTPGEMVKDGKWAELKSKGAAVSHYTLVTLKNRTGIPFQNTVSRAFSIAHIERFLEGTYPATALIAPSGWGKSTTLVHLVEHFWYSKEAKYPHDICWFIHAHAAGSLFLRGLNLSNWLDDQLSLGQRENFREYFKAHFDKIGGRLILIIDGFDEITMSSDKLKLMYTKLEEFVYSNDEFPWIKVILSVRSNTWSEIFHNDQRMPPFGRYWYLGPEMDEETNINIPRMTEQEVKSVLYNHRMDPAIVRTFSESFLQKLRYPFYLQLFCQLNTGENTFINEHLSLFEMVSRFVQMKVFSTNNNNFKINIINKLLELLDYGKKGQYADKSELLNKNAELFSAYKELLSDNILVEENLSQDIMFYVKVRFAHQFLMEYFMAMHFVARGHHQTGEAVFNDVINHLPSSPFRTGIFKWMLRYAINNGQQESIRQMFHLPLSNIEKSQLLEYLAVHYQQEGNREMSLKSIFPHGYFKRYPLSKILNDNFIHFGKRKVLVALLELSELPEDKLKIRSILFIMSLLQLDAEQCEQELHFIKKIVQREMAEEELWVTPYDLFLFIYEYLKFGIVNENIKDKLYNYGRYLNGSTRQAPTVSHELVFRFSGFAFALLGDNGHMANYSKRIFECYPALVYQKLDSVRLSLLSWQAYAALGQQDLKIALKISSHADLLLKNYSFDHTNGRHLEVMHKLMQGYAYMHENELNKAIRLTETAMEISQKMDLKLLMLMALQLLQKIYTSLKADKQLNITRQQLQLIGTSTSFKQLDKLWGQ
jgi:hypothetical protein